ncbi:hypothetical protein Tco_1548460 [Tanacetum coccineum]
MNQQEIQQAARDETLVLAAERVKISSTNMRIDPTITQISIDVELFRKILGIWPRVPNEDFVVPPSEESPINFLYELGYKGQINKPANFQYQIKYRQSKLRRREIMPYLRFTIIIVNHFLLLHKSIPKGPSSGLNTIKDAGVIQRLKFVNKDDNIIPEPDVALELGKSISQTEAEIAEEERRLLETHERLVSTKPTGVDKSDESDGAGITPEVPDELTGKTSSEGAGIVPEVPNEGKDKDITWLCTGEEEKGNKDDDEKDDDRNKIGAEKLKEEKGDEEEEQADDDQD